MITMITCNIVTPIVIGVVSGLLSSWLWWFLTTPTLELDNNIQYGRSNKKYVRLYNKHRFFTAYNIQCHIEYYHRYTDSQPYFTVSHTTKPILKPDKSGPYLTFVLNSEPQADKCFEENGKTRIIVSYQNRFGVSKSIELPELRIEELD